MAYDVPVNKGTKPINKGRFPHNPEKKKGNFYFYKSNIKAGTEVHQEIFGGSDCKLRKIYSMYDV